MKIAILAAGYTANFPIFIDKPKCLYHLNGVIQIQRVIEDAKQFVDEKDIIVVGGYKYKYLKKYLNENYPQVEFRVNFNFKEPAIYSFRTAIANINDDIIFMFADESISRKNIERIAQSTKKMAILYHDKHYYYSLGIFKLNKETLSYLSDDRYLSIDFLNDVYPFANHGNPFEKTFTIYSGECIGYMTIDLIRRIGCFDKLENPRLYSGEDIDFIHYNPEDEYIPDLDYMKDSDEYKNSVLLRFYNDFVSRAIRKILRICRVKI